jgi:hypothetical protein
VITHQHYQKIFIQKQQESEIRQSLQREIALYQQQENNLQALSDRHKRYIDSLDVFVFEKNRQLDSMNVLAKRATENTDKAIRIAKTNRAVSIGSSVLSLVLLLLMVFK